MDRQLVAIFFGAALCSAGQAAAAGGTTTDQAVSLTYAATHWSAFPAADLTGVDSAGDPLYQSGFWYRVEGDTREYPLPQPDVEFYHLDGRVVARWNNLDGKGFAVEEETWVVDQEGPSGGFWTRLTITNNNPTTVSFTLFHYLDPNVAATASGDYGTQVATNFLEFTDGSSSLSYRRNAQAGGHYQVAAFPILRDLLNDDAITSLDDTGLPFGPGNVTAAIQFSTKFFGSGATGPEELSVFVNPPRRKVKGDYWGLGLASLHGQSADRHGRYFQTTRRTLLEDTVHNLTCGGPARQVQADAIQHIQPIGLMGSDDFYAGQDGQADFSSIVCRNISTGAAYVGSDQISGAPTLPLNWKLSATGDFDADGKADILWRNTTSQKLVIWTMNGHAKIGNIIPSPAQAVDANWEVAAAADFNGDDHRDLLWYNQTSGKIVLWFMDASVVRITGQFTNPATVGNNNWRVLAVGDYGKGPGGVYDTQDIVWQNDTSKKVVVWFMDLAGNRTGGTFTVPDTLMGGWDLVGPR